LLASTLLIVDWVGLVVFAISGALVASRKEMDIIGFIWLGTVTGIGGGTLRDLILGVQPFWVAKPAYLGACVAACIITFFAAHIVHSRYRLLLWLDAIGMVAFTIAGAQRALSVGVHPIVAVAMGIITAVFGGIVRDTLAQERSVIFSKEIYVTAALAAATVYVALIGFGAPVDAALLVAFGVGFALRAGALKLGWSIPRYRPRPGGPSQR
jgi:uncharacterized membrane protein YeiH